MWSKDAHVTAECTEQHKLFSSRTSNKQSYSQIAKYIYLACLHAVLRRRHKKHIYIFPEFVLLHPGILHMAPWVCPPAERDSACAHRSGSCLLKWIKYTRFSGAIMLRDATTQRMWFAKIKEKDSEFISDKIVLLTLSFLFFFFRGKHTLSKMSDLYQFVQGHIYIPSKSHLVYFTFCL